MRQSALMYHDVLRGAPSGREGAGPAGYKVPWSAFIEQLDRIGAAVTAPPDAADDLRALPQRSGWSLTFDDGGASAVEAAEELARRGWRGYFFVTTEAIGTHGFVSADAVREISLLGHVIGSHSATHPERMSSLPFDELLEEWRGSCAALAAIIGREVRSASVPGGYYSQAVGTAARHAGIATLFTSEPTRTPRAVGDCLVVGRYVVRRGSSASAIALAAAGSGGVWLRQSARWSASKPIKVLAGDRYVRLRRALVESRRGGE